MRHPDIMQEYWNDPAATAESSINDGWLNMGDIGYLDEQGFLFIVDRKRDMIISGGENIYPREVEIALEQHPVVKQCAVIGIPDERWGEAVCAFVVPSGEATESNLIEHCRTLIASYKKPKKNQLRGGTAAPGNRQGRQGQVARALLAGTADKK